MIQEITIKEKSKWISYIKRAFQHDFYHTWSYHSMKTDGEPLLFVYEEQDTFIAFPLIKQPIKDSSYFDLTSVYGYSGPVSNFKFDDLDQSFLNNFKKKFQSFLAKGRYVSIFSRLHPFFNQNCLIKIFGGLYENGKTVTIDLTNTYEEQVAQYRYSCATSIKQLRKKGYYVKEANSIEDIRVFLSIYTANMDRICASKIYYFDETYLSNILNAKDYEGKLLLVYIGDKAISGGVITCTHGIMQAHLIATSPESLKVSPAKLLVDEVTLMGRKLNMHSFHLGGGVGFKEDTLFNWKTGFSDHRLNYYSWRFIANKTVYKRLVDKAKIENSAMIDFFPLYRYKPSAVEIPVSN